MHPILRYVKKRGITQAEFAKRVGASPQLISDVIHSRGFLGREKSLQVVQTTGGEIGLEELAAWDPDQVRAAS